MTSSQTRPDSRLLATRAPRTSSSTTRSPGSTAKSLTVRISSQLLRRAGPAGVDLGAGCARCCGPSRSWSGRVGDAGAIEGPKLPAWQFSGATGTADALDREAPPGIDAPEVRSFGRRGGPGDRRSRHGGPARGADCDLGAKNRRLSFTRAWPVSTLRQAPGSHPRGVCDGRLLDFQSFRAQEVVEALDRDSAP